jgi:hypothetical protein
MWILANFIEKEKKMWVVTKSPKLNLNLLSFTSKLTGKKRRSLKDILKSGWLIGST